MSETIDRDAAFRAYVTAALWTGLRYESELDDNPMQLDEYADADDVPAEVLEAMRVDLEAFLNTVEDVHAVEDITRLDAAQYGHDFHLTRNGHGAGFWDRGLGDFGDALAELARPYGTAELMGYASDDSSTAVYLEN